MKDFNKKIYTIIALIFLFVPALLMPFFKNVNEKDIIEYDNRYATTLKDVYNSAEKQVTFESWFSDHLAFRKNMVSAWATINHRIKVSCRPNYIVVGKGDWLFLGNIHGNKIDQYRQAIKFDKNETEKSVILLKKLYAFMRNKDVNFIFAIAPNKESVYPKYMPDWATIGSNDKFRSIFIDLAEKNSILDITLDMAYILEEKADKYPVSLFHKSDGHWSPLGSYFGYSSIMDRINNVYSTDYKKIDFNGFTIVSADGYSLQKSLGIAGNYNDFSTIVDTFPNYEIEKVFLTKNDTWKDFCVYENENALNDNSILIIGDSFSKKYMSYFYNTFNKTYFVHYLSSLYGEDNIENLNYILETSNPDVVVFEMIERTLPYTLPQLSDDYNASSSN